MKKNPMTENIILVDENDKEVGLGEKLQVHREGRLHRAFSIFVFNSDNQMLIQQRNRNKYHSGGLWANTCCSHPRAGERLAEAAHRRLKEEMGFDCELTEIFSFIYKTGFDNGLIEHELDHVFAGTYDGEIKPNPEEAEAVEWIGLDELEGDLENQPGKYAYWFKQAISRVIGYKKRGSME